MRRLYTIIAFTILVMSASAQVQDTTFVHFDFNQNPWGLPTSAMSGWANYADENGILPKTKTFPWDVDGEELKVILTPTDINETDYENCLVKGENSDNGNAVETILFTRTGSTLTFIAPPSKYMTKVAFDTYRRWSSGGLYSGDATNNQHVWGPDSTKTRTYTSGGQVIEYECWHGDSVEWGLPACTGQTYLRYIDFWLLPRVSSGITTQRMEARQGEVLSIDGVLLRRNGNLEGLRKGIYIVDGKKRIIR